jgi:hypothetical protein
LDQQCHRMSEINTLMNFSQTWMSSWPDTIEEERVKTLCLFNDHVILSVDNNLTSLYREGLAERFKVNEKKIKSLFLSIEEITNDPDIYKSTFEYRNPDDFLSKTSDEQANRLYMRDIATNQGISVRALNKTLKSNTWGSYGYFKEIFYSKLSVINSLSIYQRINEKIPCSLAGFSNGESYVINKCIEYNAKLNNIPLDTLRQEIDYTIPSLANLSWGQVFELRTDKRIKSFKEWINGNKPEIEKKGLREIVFKELWDVMGQLKPNILVDSVKATIGNLPLPIPINPLSLVAEAVDLYKNKKFNRKYAWLLFLYDLQNKVSKSQKG